MRTIWRKGRLVLFGLLFGLSLSIASILSIMPAKVAIAGSVPFQGRYYNNSTLNWKQVTSVSGFIGAYYNNRTLSGVPKLMRTDREINFAWGRGSPYPSTIPADNFSVRWTVSTELNTGQYLFTVTADDGVRLYLDGKLIIDKWKDQPPTTYNAIKWINAGTHTIKMEYYEHGGEATAKFNWQTVSSNGGYVGVYYDNQTLSGTPTQMRIDPAVNFTWGNGSPDPTIPTDHFSARWIRNVIISEEASYNFRVTADDGVRLFVDGAPIIDKWRDQPPTTYSRMIWLTQGTHEIIMEYYENAGSATAKLSFQRVSS